jgi:hypothetical protein
MKARTCRSEFSSVTPPELAPQTGARRNRIAGLLGMAISILVLCVVAVQCHRIDMTVLRQMLPTSVGFWLVFTANYFSGPIGDWIIFRRLWRIPWSGLGALVRKLVTNELVFGYLGETQFYAWARANMTVAPFGAIKDVAVLSALVGNVATLALLACCWPVVTAVALGIDTRSTALSLAAVLLSSFAMFVFRQKLFTLPCGQLWFIGAIHAARTVVALVLSALLWHLVLPQVALRLWLVMSAFRMLVSRLPLVPNNELLFAGFVVFLLGREPQVGELMTMIAALTLGTHVVVGAGLAIADLVMTKKVSRDALLH